ncbi:MAG: hypothetical protein DHS20C16_19850 [Phycisphaerae bacterium]|nr:MAG: hypothetical protein DHS20C16_19850 [Phycisphaerae bacterium]
MRRIIRNRILISVIALGLLNFAVYTFFYWYFQGDASNGFIRGGQFFLKGHFLRMPDGQASEAVSKGVWIYSYLHSITIWPTAGAVVIAMLILSRPHIIATINSDSFFDGRLLVNGCLLFVSAVSIISMAIFMFNFWQALEAIRNGQDFGL